MIAYTLNKNISIENISKDINSMVEKFRKDNPEKIPILTIDIRTITREDTSLIPKLEYHEIVPPNISNSSGCS